MNRIGLFFGSFDPVHFGHLIIADYLLGEKLVDKVWFVISPQNPLKQHLTQCPQQHRVAMLQSSIEEHADFSLCDVELSMPRPNYTWKTLQLLQSKYPENQFHLIVGGDNIEIFHKWKDFDKILNNTPILVYPRLNSNPGLLIQHKNVLFVQAPIIEISSTYIRESIQKGYTPRYMLHPKCIDYISQNHLYLHVRL